MKCPRCHHENRSGAKFCEECATGLAATCSNCGGQLSATAKFCPECAHPVAATPTEARLASPQSYTPKHLAEKILFSKAAFEGERKEVTVLFADLKGSMELLADRDPEEARKILDPVLEHMMEAVHRYEGTVNQVMGDGIMALFGAPLAHEDHALRACYAALRMQDRVTQYAEAVHQAEGAPIQIRIGLNSGEVVVRSIGSDLHMDYTAVGQTTHLAARMEQMARPGSILISPGTLALAEGYVVVKPLGARPIKGLDNRVDIYQLVGAATVRSRFQAAATRGLTRFVGREAELDQLRHALAQAGAGHGQVVAVVGEPGVGKSRLYWEFTHSDGVQGWRVIESGSAFYGKATNYLPVIELLRAYFEIEARDEPRKIREKVTGKLLSLDHHLQPALPTMLWLLDVPVDDPAWDQLDPPQRGQQILDSVTRLLLRESQVQPLIVVFEDLHWIDAETQMLLDRLVESLPRARVLLLVNYRPEYQHAWSDKISYRQLWIDPLPPESVEELLEALLGHDGSLQSLKQLLIERTEGNPFFLEESIRTLIETKVLTGERGTYRLTKARQGLESTLQIPATARAVLAARIDRLAAEDKRLLQAASVIGKEIPVALLEATMNIPDDELRSSLGRLQAAEFLYETRLFPDLEFTFKHALTCEVTYQSLLKSSRGQYHQRIAEVLTAQFPETVETRPELLAHHYTEAGLSKQAVPYWLRAGQRAIERSANAEAVTYLTKGLAVLESVPAGPARLQQELALQLALGAPLTMLKGHAAPEVQQIYARAHTLSQQLEGGPQRVSILRGLWFHSFDQANYQAAHELGAQCLALAESLNDPTLHHEAYRMLWGPLFMMGDIVAARAQIERSIALIDREKYRTPTAERTLNPGVLSLGYASWTLWMLGYPDQARTRSHEAALLAEELSHAYTRVFALHHAGILRQFLRQVELVQENAEIVIPLSRNGGFVRCLAGGMMRRGWALAELGATTEGIGQMEAGLATWRTMGVELGQPLLLAHLAEAYGRASRPEEGLRVITEALAIAHRTSERYYESELLRLKGELLLQSVAGQESDRYHPRVVEGEGCFSRAVAMARQRQAKSLELRAAISLGRLWNRQNKRADARRLLVEIYGWFTEGFDIPDLREAKSLLDALHPLGNEPCRTDAQ
jgi:class 3 adenylate cyclase/predicted ATPase